MKVYKHVHYHYGALQGYFMRCSVPGGGLLQVSFKEVRFLLLKYTDTFQTEIRITSTTRRTVNESILNSCGYFLNDPQNLNS